MVTRVSKEGKVRDVSTMEAVGEFLWIGDLNGSITLIHMETSKMGRTFASAVGAVGGMRVEHMDNAVDRVWIGGQSALCCYDSDVR